jgi:hypothetical protein
MPPARRDEITGNRFLISEAVAGFGREPETWSDLFTAAR